MSAIGCFPMLGLQSFLGLKFRALGLSGLEFRVCDSLVLVLAVRAYRRLPAVLSV